MNKEKQAVEEIDKFSDSETLDGFYIKILSGPLINSEFPLKKSSVTLGRSSDADIQIKDSLISRIHCRLTYENEKWFIEDLASTNGTWMVGQKVEKKVYLPPRTSVRIGKTIFEISDVREQINDDFLSKTISYRIQPDTLTSISSGLAQVEEKPVLKKHIVEKPIEKAEKETSHLSAVYKFQNIIAAALEEEDLYAKVLKGIFSVIKADRAYLLIYDLSSGGFVPKVALSDKGFLANPNIDEINKAMVAFVKENREAVLSIMPCPEDAPELPQFPDRSKVQRSIMCVPLLGKQQINGLFYLILTSDKIQYTEDSLRLMTVLGHTSGMALEHLKMMEFNLKNERLVATGATAAGLSHYIKNILAGLDGSLNLLRMAIDEKDLSLANESWNILHKNHRRLGNLVLDLLNLASEQKPNFEIHDVNAIVRDVAELLSSQLQQEGITLNIDPSCYELPLYAEIDPKGIHRVLLNLVTNSEHAVLAKQKHLEDKNIGEISITTAMNESKDYVVITVADNGVGVEKEEMEKMFDLFVTSKGSAGTGLGLAVCKRIIEAHSGNITASGEKGKGCTISFSLPVAHNEMNTTTISIKKIF